MNSDRWIVCCFVALVVSSLSSLQAVEIELADIAHNNQHTLDNQKGRFQRHLAVRITDLKRTCSLTEKQTKKLEVASKGAVEEAMRQFVERFPQLKAQDQPNAVPPQGQLGLQLAPLVPAVAAQRVAVDIAQVDAIPIQAPDEAPQDLAPPIIEAPPAADGGDFVDVFVAPAVQAFPAAVWQGNQNFQMEPVEAASTVVWRNAIEGVLTDEQKEVYRQAQIQRRHYRRQTVVDRVVASVDRRLFLSDKQRKALAKVISDTLGENLDNMVPHGGFTSDSMVAAQVVAQVPKDKLEGVLEPAQIDSWHDVHNVQAGGMVFHLER